MAMRHWVRSCRLAAYVAALALAACRANAPHAQGGERRYAAAATQPYDVVLEGGRVIDPESGMDAVANVGIAGGRIAAVTTDTLRGAWVQDVRGKIVSPGFIDLHSHSPTRLGQDFQVREGVTTALDLESGAYPVAAYGSAIGGRHRVHYGASVGYLFARLRVKSGVKVTHSVEAESPGLAGPKGIWTAIRSLFTEPREAFTEALSPGEQHDLTALIEDGLAGGGLGIGLPLDYMSGGVSDAELQAVFDVAAARGVPLFIHIRRGVNGDPAGLDEVLRAARRSGAAIHVCHITHNAMRNIDLFLAKIAEARTAGVDVTTEMLPFDAGSTFIGAEVFHRDWQTIFGISYGDVEWAATGERFTEETWRSTQLRYPRGNIIHHYIRESWARRAVTEPGVVIATDLMPMHSLDEKVAPFHSAFARVLGRYVREARLLEFPEAVAKMSWLPAKRLESFAPAFRKKGRLQVGADADVTVFDPATVIDRATYQDPYQSSAGIDHVLVAGRFVVREGRLLPGAYPGRRMGTGSEAAE